MPLRRILRTEGSSTRTRIQPRREETPPARLRPQPRKAGKRSHRAVGGVKYVSAATAEAVTTAAAAIQAPDVVPQPDSANSPRPAARIVARRLKTSTPAPCRGPQVRRLVRRLMPTDLSTMCPGVRDTRSRCLRRRQSRWSEESTSNLAAGVSRSAAAPRRPRACRRLARTPRRNTLRPLRCRGCYPRRGRMSRASVVANGATTSAFPEGVVRSGWSDHGTCRWCPPSALSRPKLVTRR
jgi:hypothetical protein